MLRLCFDVCFLSSLIIHEEKTKEITTVKEVWICDPNYQKIRWTFALNFSRIVNALRSYIKHSKECSIRYPNTSKLVKKTLGYASFFQPASQCLDIWLNTLPRVWYITSKLSSNIEENRANYFSIMSRQLHWKKKKWMYRKRTIVGRRTQMSGITAVGIWK